MIYLDSCILIYAVQDDGRRGTNVRRSVASEPDAVFAIRTFVALQCLVGPLRDENQFLQDHDERVFEQFRRLRLGEKEFTRAAQLRARHGIKTPDALHLATAQLSGCEQLWTNDTRLAGASQGLAVNVS